MNGLRTWKLGPHATANFALVLVVLVLNSIVVHQNSIALHNEQQSANRSSEGLLQSRTLFSSFSDEESAVLGFAVTGDESFLHGHDQRLLNFPGQIRQLTDLISANPSQAQRAAELKNLGEARLSELQSVVEARKQGFEEAQEVVQTGTGKRLMEQIRQIIVDLETEQSRQMGASRQAQDQRLFKVLAANLAAVCFGTVLTIISWSSVDRELRRRRKAEANALSERQNLWVTLTSIGDGVIVADASGRVKLANPVARQLMGDPPEIEGRLVPDIFSVFDAKTHEPITNPLSQILSEGTFAPRVGFTVLRRADGSEIPIEENAAPIRDSMGRLSGVVFVFRDCSERQRLEKEKGRA